MLRITAADDDEKDRQTLEEYIRRYFEETGEAIDITLYASAIDLLEEYKRDADILFLDIEMSGTDGMSAAREIRKSDDRVAIVFVTNMANYALSGYEVDACDFLVKPISYDGFAVHMQRACEWAGKRRGHHVVLTDSGSMVRIRTTRILWIEKDRNYLVWNTRDGIFREKGSISTAIQKLASSGVSESFAECCTGFLVNLEHVERIDKDSLLVSGNRLPISRRLRKEFLKAFSLWG